MKKTNRFIAMAAALTLTASAMIPMFAFADNDGGGTTPTGATIVITRNGTDTAAEHTYASYQIFTGTQDATEKNMLTDVAWGTGIDSTKMNTFLTALFTANIGFQKANPEYDADAAAAAEANNESYDVPQYKALETAEEVSNALGSISDNSAAIDKFAAIVAANKGTAGTLTGLSDGYYLVMDSEEPTLGTTNSGAYTKYIVAVTGAQDTNKTITVNEKAAAPTVDKQILDEATEGTALGSSNMSWGEAADHAINEQFQFKLIATIPAETALKNYSAYKIVFNDSMSAGVTYDSIASVKISSTTTLSTAVTVADTNYAVAGVVKGDAGKKWTLTIDDIKSLVNANNADVFGKEVVTVEVIYNAHLNANAIRDGLGTVNNYKRTGNAFDLYSSTTTGSPDTNQNAVYLKYSNNPNAGGESSLGETPKDWVYAFTYDVTNIKYKDSVATANVLAGAEFQLLNGTTPIKLIDNADGTYTVADQTASLAAASGTTKAIVDKMISHTGDGKFDILGLDAGTYTLKETKAPTGYNTCDDITIEIVAAHAEQTSDSTKVDLDLTGSSGLTNNIVDTAGSKLPETGGIGTTLFYIGGGCMAGVAGILLITKKRAKNANN